MPKAQTYRDQGEEELAATYHDLCKELLALRNQKRLAGNKMDRPHEIGETRRNIARVLTLLREKELMKESMS